MAKLNELYKKSIKKEGKLDVKRELDLLEKVDKMLTPKYSRIKTEIRRPLTNIIDVLIEIDES